MHSFLLLKEKNAIIKIYFPEVKSKQLDDINTLTKVETVTITKTGSLILLIDDESMITSYLKDLLEGEGYSVISFNNSIQGLAYFNENPDKIDIIITDQTMPGLTGLELSKSILQSGQNIPIILCTGYSDFENEITKSKNGIDVFMNKPLDDDLLLQNISNLLIQYQTNK